MSEMITRALIKTARVLLAIAIGTAIGTSLSYGIERWTASYSYYAE